jgi:hypothetical protein
MNLSSSYWDFAAKFRKDGSPVTTHGGETHIYRKHRGAWRLIHVQYSGMRSPNNANVSDTWNAAAETNA